MVPALAAWAGVALGGHAGLARACGPAAHVALAAAALAAAMPLLALARGTLPRLGAVALVLAAFAAGGARGAAHAAWLDRLERRVIPAPATPGGPPLLLRLRARLVTPPRREGERPDAIAALVSPAGALPAGARLRVWLPAGSTAEWGDVIASLARVEPPSGPRVPGAGSARDAARAADVIAHAWVFAPRVERARGAWAAPGATVMRWRRAIEVAFARGLSAPARELVVPLVTGDRARLGPELATGLQAAGLTHLIALSGLHVVWFAAAAEGLTAWTGGGVVPRAVAGALAAVLYALLAGPIPSLVRAAVTGVVAAAARAAGRALDPLQALAVTVLLVLAWAPAWAGDLGFQLSCLATVGLVTIGRALDRACARLAPSRVPAHGMRARLARRVRGAAAGLGAIAAPTVAAQIATLPLVLGRFHVLAWTAVAANLVAVPVCGVLLAAAWIGALAEIAWPGSGGWSLGACDVLAAALRAVCEGAARVPHALLATGHEPGVLAVAWCAVVMLAAGALEPPGLDARARGRSPARWLALCGGAFAATLALALVLTVRPLRPPADRWWLVAIDVGQGEALALGFHDGWWLVDAGPRTPRRDAGRDAVLPFLRWAGVRRLERVVLTHDDLDHTGGASAVCAELPADVVHVPWPSRAAFDLRGARVRPVAAGETLRSAPLVRVLWPPREGRADSDNRGAIVLAAGEPAARALLTSDVDSVVERALAPAAAALAPLALLKAGHHGSGSSTSASWLAALEPRDALISCGLRNHFGHPHPAVLARLAAAGVRVHRTDLGGTRWFELGPDGLAVVGWRDEPPAVTNPAAALAGVGSHAHGWRARAARAAGTFSARGIAAAPSRW